MFGRKANRRGVSIRARLLMAFMLVGVVPAVLIALLLYRNAYNELMKNASASAADSLQLVSSHVATRMGSVDNVVLSLAINENIKAYLNETDPLQLGRNRRSIEKSLQSVCLTISEVSDIMILDVAGNLYTAGSRSFAPEFVSGFRHSDSYLESAGRYGRNTWFAYGSLRDKILMKQLGLADPIMVTVCQIKAFLNPREVAAVMVTTVDTDAFRKVLDDPQFRQQGTLFLLDQNGRAMLSSTQDEAVDASRFSGRLADGSGAFEADIGAERYLVNYARMEATGWYTVSLKSVDSLTRDIRAMLNRTLIICAAVLALALMITGWVLIDFTAGLRMILRGIDRIKSGDLVSRIGSSRNDELGELAQSFDEMVGRVDRLLETTREQERLIAVTRMMTLEASLAPHFLYNTLDSINWMLIKNGQAEISEAVIMLSDVLRYSMDAGRGVVALREELDAISAYLYVCRLRFEDRLTYSIDVPPELMDFPISRFLLHPLVENAVRHGIERVTGGGVVSLRALREAGHVVIELRDSGRGFAPDVLANIRANQAYVEGSERHIGLANVIGRLRLIYGDAFSLTLSNAPEGGALVVLRLPDASAGEVAQ